MLVLTRKQGESIRIGDDVYLTVVRVNAGQVRLGFTAPRGVNIVRTEVPRREDPQPPTPQTP